MEAAIASGDAERILQLENIRRRREERAAELRSQITEELKQNEATATPNDDSAARARREAKRQELMLKLRATNEAGMCHISS